MDTICPIVRTMYRIRNTRTGLYYSNSGRGKRWTRDGTFYKERSHVTLALSGAGGAKWGAGARVSDLVVVPTVVQMFELETVPVREWKTKKDGGE